jgi:hypothetical protein
MQLANQLVVHTYEGQTTQWQKDKGPTTIYKTLHRKLKIEQSNTNPTKTGAELRCSRRVSSSCSTSGTRRVTLATQSGFNCMCLSMNISAISWRPVLVVDEGGVLGENHRPWASNWSTLSLAVGIILT